MYSSNEIRQQFIDFFCKKHGHRNIKSSPVVPLDDPTLLFANAGMNQFKPYFLGTEKPTATRVANSQKCIRAGGKHNDLDDVGKDTYHHTFFEMLGNWSFGDYFKKEAITWAWELLTDIWKLDPTRLHVTIFEGDEENQIPRDDEAGDFWKAVGVPPERIHLGNKKDNFWEMGNTGPCGPCTEVHFDATPDRSGGPLVNQGTDKVIEIWNLVFIQFNRNEDKSLTPLPAKHVDTGMGFERITKVIQGKSSNYDTDIFMPLFAAIQATTGAPAYTGILLDLRDTAYRVIADHIRTLTFALTDGAVVGNDGRDYVLKRILRRAERYGVQVLGTTKPFLHQLVPTVVSLLGEAFPELRKNPEKVREQIYAEEEGFLRTLHRGIRLFNSLVEQMNQEKRKAVSGSEAFKLHDTYGVLSDITQQMAEERGLTVDLDAFKCEMELSKEKARQGGKKFVAAAVQGELPPTDDSFKYQPEIITAALIGWFADNAVIREGKLQAGAEVALLLDRTNFYGEQGGQVGDTGTIRSAQGADFEVTDTQRLGNTILHIGILHGGNLTVGDTVELVQSTERRLDIMRNHTATHLLNLALKQTLGGHVEQKGSLVDSSKTRFDFSHDKPLLPEQIQEIEHRVNRSVAGDQIVTAVLMPLEEAKQLPGVRAVFGEKYPDPVRVVMIGADQPAKVQNDLSTEFCGGTHLASTGQVGYFKITAQEGVAKGIRRITAITGKMAYAEIESRSIVVDELAAQLQCKPGELSTRIESLQLQVKKLQEQVSKGAAAGLAGEIDKLIESAPTLGGAKLIVGTLPEGTSAEGVRTQVERIRHKCPSSFSIFGWIEEGDKVSLLVALTADLVKRGLKAGEVVKQLAVIVGGSGGGRPEMAQAGGKEPSKLPEAMRKASQIGSDALLK